MRVITERYAAVFFGLAAILALGCGDSSGPAAPKKTGAIRITVSTASEEFDRDFDGYTLSLDGGLGYRVDIDAIANFDALPIGRHVFRLRDLQSNCAVNGDNPMLVDAIADRPASLGSFSVTCVPRTETGGWDY